MVIVKVWHPKRESEEQRTSRTKKLNVKGRRRTKTLNSSWENRFNFTTILLSNYRRLLAFKNSLIQVWKNGGKIVSKIEIFCNSVFSVLKGLDMQDARRKGNERKTLKMKTRNFSNKKTAISTSSSFLFPRPDKTKAKRKMISNQSCVNLAFLWYDELGASLARDQWSSFPFGRWRNKKGETFFSICRRQFFSGKLASRMLATLALG